MRSSCVAKSKDNHAFNQNIEQSSQPLNIKRVSQKSQKKEKTQKDEPSFVQNEYNIDFSKTPSTLLNSSSLKKNENNHKESFNPSFQNNINKSNLQYLNSFKNDKQMIIRNETSYDGMRIENKFQKSFDDVVNKNDCSLKSQQFLMQINQKLQQNQMQLINETRQNNFNQAVYLNRISKCDQQDMSMPPQQSYLEYAKQIIKISDEQLQHLQKLTPSKRQSHDRHKKSVNKSCHQIKNNQQNETQSKIYLDEPQINQTQSKLRMVENSPTKSQGKIQKQKVKQQKKSTEKQIINEQNFEQTKSDISNNLKRKKNRPKSNGFQNNQGQILKKKSSQKMNEFLKKELKLDASQKSINSIENGRAQYKQQKQQEVCISIKQLKSPSKSRKSIQRKSLSKFITKVQPVSQSLILNQASKESLKTQHLEKIEKKQSQKKIQKKIIQVSQSTNKIVMNATHRCKTSMKNGINESFVEQKVKIMQDEYLRSQKSQRKDINDKSRKSLLNAQKLDNSKQNTTKDKVIVNKQLNNQINSSKQIFQPELLTQSTKTNDNILNQLRMSVQNDFFNNVSNDKNLKKQNNNDNHKQAKNTSVKNVVDQIKNKKLDLSLQDYSYSYEDQDTFKTNKSIIVNQTNKNDKISDQSFTDKSYSRVETGYSSKKKKNIDSQLKNKTISNEGNRKSLNEFRQQKNQTFSHIRIITKQTEGIINEIKKNSIRESQQILAGLITNKNSNNSPTKIKKEETQQKLNLIYTRFGAVVKGYKTRRIYNKSKLVKQDRFEFRDLIQFAYQLKQELSIIQQKQNESVKTVKDVNIKYKEQQKFDAQIEQTKKLLLQSLKDLIQKRQQFSVHFNKLLDSGAEWIYESKSLQRSKKSSTPDNKQIQSNYLRKSSSLEPFVNSSRNTKKQSQISSPKKLKSNNKDMKTLNTPSQMYTENSPQKEKQQSDNFNFSNYQRVNSSNILNQSSKISNLNDKQYIQKEEILKQKSKNGENDKLNSTNESLNPFKNNYIQPADTSKMIKQDEIQTQKEKNDYCFADKDHVAKKLQQKKRQISQLTFGESADINLVNQSRTESMLNDFKKLQEKRVFTKSGLKSNNSINEDNIPNIMSHDSPSKKFQSMKNNKYYCQNSIKESPINKKNNFNSNQDNIKLSQYVNQTQKQNIESPKKGLNNQNSIIEPQILKDNYKSTQLFIIDKERDQLIDEQALLNDENERQSKLANSSKKQFLKKGERSRRFFDPLTSIQNEKFQREKSKQQIDSSSQLQMNENQEKQNHFQSQHQNDSHQKSQTNIQNIHQMSVNKSDNSRSKNENSLTPKSHTRSLKRFVKSYQSPYQQNAQVLLKQLTCNSQIKKDIDIQNENTSQQYLVDSINIQLQEHKQINAQDEKRLSINFVSKIPRITSGVTSVGKNFSPSKTPINASKKLDQNESQLNRKQSINITQQQKQIKIDNQKFASRGSYQTRDYDSRNKNESKNRENQNIQSHNSSMHENSQKRKNSITNNISGLNNSQSHKKKENLVQINEMIKQQNLQYLQNLSQNKQSNKHVLPNHNMSNQELSQELNKIRQSLVLKNLVVQKDSQSNFQTNSYENSKKYSCNEQIKSQDLQKMSGQKKFIQMSKSKPSNRYHEKSESDASAFSQVNIYSNDLKKENQLSAKDYPTQEQFITENQNIYNDQYNNNDSQINKSPSSPKKQQSVRFIDQIDNDENENYQKSKYTRQETSPSIRDIAGPDSQNLSPQSNLTKKGYAKLENLTPIKNMNFENQYVTCLKKNNVSSQSPKRPDFLNKVQKPEFSFNLIGLKGQQKYQEDNQQSNEKNLNQLSNNYESNVSQEQKKDNQIIISIFDNKKCLQDSLVNSMDESLQSSQQKQFQIVNQSKVEDDKQEQYVLNETKQMNENQKQNEKQNQFQKFLNHQQQSVQDKDTGTFRIQPLKINSAAHTSSIMSSVQGEMNIINDNQFYQRPSQTQNHSKFNSLYDAISPQINPCCSETINKYNLSPSVKSSSPMQKIDSPIKNENNSPLKKNSSQKKLGNINKENIRNDKDQYDVQIQSYMDQNKNQILENQTYLNPQIIRPNQVLNNQKLVLNESSYNSQNNLAVNTSDLRSQGTESRRRSRGERNVKGQKPVEKQKSNFTSVKSQISSELQNKVTSNKLKDGCRNNSQIEQADQLFTQNSLEVPDVNVPKALPTPQRHDYKVNISPVRTPIKIINDEDQSGYTNTVSCKNQKHIVQHTPVNKNENFKRLTQKKKSQECQKDNKSVSPFKTPQKHFSTYQQPFSTGKSQLNDKSENKSSKFDENSCDSKQINAQVDSQKIQDTIDQLKNVLQNLKSHDKEMSNQDKSQAKYKQIEEMIQNLLQQQKMLQQYVNEQQPNNRTNKIRF